MSILFSPSCALSLYKRELAEKLFNFLKQDMEDIEITEKCCRNKPVFAQNDKIFNVCPGCDTRFGKLTDGSGTESVWLYIAESNFPFPQYENMEVAVHEPCNFRRRTDVQNAVRKILSRMNIKVTDIEKSREKAVCCGGSFTGDKVEMQSQKRLVDFGGMPVVTYCVGCMNLLSFAGGKVYHIIDLLFNEITAPTVKNRHQWNEIITKYIEEH